MKKGRNKKFQQIYNITIKEIDNNNKIKDCQV